MAHELPVFVLDVGVVGADVHELSYAAAALTHGDMLKQLTELIEYHNGDALFIIAQRDRAHRCYRHEKVFVERLAVFYALERLDERFIADGQIGDEVQRKLQPALHRQQLQRRDHHRRGDNAPQRILLLLVHGHTPLNLLIS